MEYPIVEKLGDGLEAVRIAYDYREPGTTEIVRRMEYTIRWEHGDGPPYMTLTEWIMAVKHLVERYGGGTVRIRTGMSDTMEEGVPDGTGSVGSEEGTTAEG